MRVRKTEGLKKASHESRREAPNIREEIGFSSPLFLRALKDTRNEDQEIILMSAIDKIILSSRDTVMVI